MPNLRALTSCQHDDCASEVSHEVATLRIFADRPICYDCYHDGAYGSEDWFALPPALPIDYEGLEGLRAFLGDLFRTYRDSDHSDIDGCDFQDLLDKHGLTERRAITEAEALEEWVIDSGFVEGDHCHMYSPTMLTLMRRPS